MNAIIRLVPALIGIPMIGFWFWMFDDFTRNRQYFSEQARNYWFFAFFIFNIIGAFWYYLVEYQPRHR